MKAIKNFNLIWIGFFLFLPFSNINAQTPAKKEAPRSYWYLNLNGGSSIFFGDIKEKSLMPTTVNGHSEWRMAGGLQFGRQISPVFGLRLQALYGQLAGVKSTANEYFQTDYMEANLNATVSINNLIAGYKADRKWDVYLLAGIGLTNYNSTIYNLSNDAVLAKVGFGNGKGIGGRTLEGIAIGGLGFKYNISNRLSLQLETAHRIMNSDAMDHWEKNFKYDIYNYTSLGVSIRLWKNRPKHQYKKTQTPSLPLLDTKNTQTQKPVKRAEPTGRPVTPPVTPAKKEIPTQQKQVKQQPIRTIQPVKPILEYRVQIRAKYGKPISVEYLSKKYNIPQTRIRTNIHNGYYIYTVGAYDAYSQARARRDVLRTQNGVTDAFVVAFKNGRRLDKLP